MSDRCYGWRMLLSRHADGDLSRYEWEALDDHLAGCHECRTAAQSDRTLHLMLSSADFGFDHESSRRLDDSILCALGVPERLTLSQRTGRGLRELWARWEAVPNLTLMQFGIGTLAAASLTAVFLLTALHPLDFQPRTAAAARLAVHQRNEPPVPLESLLDRPQPRAALLWTPPSHTQTKEENAAPAASPSLPNSPQNERHDALPASPIRG